MALVAVLEGVNGGLARDGVAEQVTLTGDESIAIFGSPVGNFGAVGDREVFVGVKVDVGVVGVVAGADVEVGETDV